MLKLLAGVRVLDLTTVVQGPYATQMIGDFGAEVIKVEPPAGDAFRAVRPGRSPSMGAGFLNCNRNKRSIVLDLTKDEGRQAFLRLAKNVDVIVHNMRERSARKLGIDYEAVRAINPGILYCYASGYGQNGPLADQPAYDDIIQAASGLAYINATPDGTPRFVPTIIADKVGGLHLALAVLAALAARGLDGQGRCIEIPMFEGLVSFLMMEQLSGRSFRPDLGATGYARLNSPNRKPFPTADGFISIIPYTTVHWKRFFSLIDRPDMLEDMRVIDPVTRSGHIDELYAMIDAVAPKYTTKQWIAMLEENDIPCSRVNRPDDLLDNEHLRAVGMFREFVHPSEGDLVGVRSPFVIAGDETEGQDLPVPLQGQHTDEVLLEFGFSDEEIAQMRAAGALGRTTETA
ncbi:CaiB/BaiF CoA transferase family protein [Novosphingobium malaysiense]|uniref:Acetyl-CoA acetyltransferase n=1 Tax=Novosphingobium malaysiense TaxID=1348853 RepID=A0A0B1ZKH8_9SPHN|nr:CoA transferase [Novosphingobium malaysiense]KHK89844.1 acetyl-CoA acetyltransferase [Novosphingobium malaysiense]